MQVREFHQSDCEALVAILKANLQYGDAESDGPDAMRRVRECPAAVFLVAEDGGVPVGFVRGVYDGSKALIHIVSVRPDLQRRGIGTALVRAAAQRFRERGATSLAVTVPGDHLSFWKRLSFRLTTRIMVAHSIEAVTGEQDT
ncbi:MAG TPA: GNAT family N-acetyltransferase [Anaerolineae bacterium]|nr:GNAT family N-acetyltransferase [Anaerolineae bacterium]HPL27068.1 GNAT family N-acetyltransferase [Anaerolineae bacterium]